MIDADLFTAASNGDRRALARLITAIEAGDEAARAAVNERAAGPGAVRLGVTGPPGAGKSTLVNALVSRFRAQGFTVGVLAVDPTSPITGGALLGDRIRMQEHVDDAGVFIRSMATRGHLGGLSAAASVTIAALAHAKFDVVIVETVGVGQSEVEVMHLVDKVILVLTPGWGDQVQADKAGIVEIADIFVINKGDLPGADKVRRALGEALGDDSRPILVTTAITGEGLEPLVDILSGLI